MKKSLTDLIFDRVDEGKWNAWRISKGKRVGDPVNVDADNSNDAGLEASKIFGGNIDPFTIDVEELSNNLADRINDNSLDYSIDCLYAMSRLLRSIASSKQPSVSLQSWHVPIGNKILRIIEDLKAIESLDRGPQSILNDVIKQLDLASGIGDPVRVDQYDPDYLADNIRFLANTLENDVRPRLNEGKWRAWRDRSHTGNHVDVDADKQGDAKRAAAKEFGDVNMFSVDVEKIDKTSWRTQMGFAFSLTDKMLADIEKSARELGVFVYPAKAQATAKKISSALISAIDALVVANDPPKNDSPYTRNLIDGTSERAQALRALATSGEIAENVEVTAKAMGLLRALKNAMLMLVNDSMLTEAQRDADYLKKINMHKIRDSEPDLDPRELQARGSDGPVFNKRVLDLIASLEDHQLPRENRKQFVKWLASQEGLWRSNDQGAVSYVSDWINGAGIEISDLPESFDDAHELSRQWHESLSSEKLGSAIEVTGQENVVYEFSDGFKVIELMPEECAAESDSMQNCVRGDVYVQGIRSGEMKLFSLRDPENRPHVTVSVVPGRGKGVSWKVEEVKGKQNEIPIEKYAWRIREWLKTTGFDTVNSPDYFSILPNDERKGFLTKSKSRPGAFLDLVVDILVRSSSLSVQDMTKIALGAAMAVIKHAPDQKRTRELLGVVRDWTQGRASDKDVKGAEKELHGMYHAIASGATAVSWAVSDALDAGFRPRKIISLIEKEIGMPLEDFLFKEGKENDKITVEVRDLRKLVQEILCETPWEAWRTKGGKRVGKPVYVDADSTSDAGIAAAKLFGPNVDPLTVDLEELDEDATIRESLKFVVDSLKGLTRIDVLKDIGDALYVIEHDVMKPLLNVKMTDHKFAAAHRMLAIVGHDIANEFQLFIDIHTRQAYTHGHGPVDIADVQHVVRSIEWVLEQKEFEPVLDMSVET